MLACVGVLSCESVCRADKNHSNDPDEELDDDDLKKWVRSCVVRVSSA